MPRIQCSRAVIYVLIAFALSNVYFSLSLCISAFISILNICARQNQGRLPKMRPWNDSSHVETSTFHEFNLHLLNKIQFLWNFYAICAHSGIHKLISFVNGNAYFDLQNIWVFLIQLEFISFENQNQNKLCRALTLIYPQFAIFAQWIRRHIGDTMGFYRTCVVSVSTLLSQDPSLIRANPCVNKSFHYRVRCFNL